MRWGRGGRLGRRLFFSLSFVLRHLCLLFLSGGLIRPPGGRGGGRSEGSLCFCVAGGPWWGRGGGSEGLRSWARSSALQVAQVKAGLNRKGGGMRTKGEGSGGGKTA